MAITTITPVQINPVFIIVIDFSQTNLFMVIIAIILIQINPMFITATILAQINLAVVSPIPRYLFEPFLVLIVLSSIKPVRAIHFELASLTSQC